MSLDDELEQELSELARHNRLRALRPTDGADRVHTDTEGRTLLSFCSNDYLGLAAHPAVTAAAQRAATTCGVGAGAARLVSGDTRAHHALEGALASMVGLPAALLFPTGYQANLGVLGVLAGREDLIVSDSANHASIIDSCRLSRATVLVYPHADADAAARALASPGAYRRRFLVTESIFSMDGDRAPLPLLAVAARRCGAYVIVDEAHALGVAGPAGGGVCRALGVVPDALVGTLGKAFGALGGFVAGSHRLTDVLANRARSFVYTTASPAPIVAAAAVAVAIAASPTGDDLRSRARGHAATIRSVLARLAVPTSGEDLIVPVVIGSEQAALRAAAALFERGFLVPAIRPPTVPDGTARLRITVSAAHNADEVDRLGRALGAILPAAPSERRSA